MIYIMYLDSGDPRVQADALAASDEPLRASGPSRQPRSPSQISLVQGHPRLPEKAAGAPAPPLSREPRGPHR